MLRLLETHRARIGTVYVFETNDGRLVEAYWSGDYVQSSDAGRTATYGGAGRISNERKQVIRLSSSSGCPYRCAPCDAGRAGYAGELAAEEIVEQFRAIVADRGIDTCSKLKLHLSKVGEPTLNLQAAMSALENIAAGWPHLDPFPVVSTLPRSAERLDGLVERLFRWEHPRKGLKINVGSTDEARRRALYGSVLPLEDVLRSIVERLPERRGHQRITLTILALPDERVDPSGFGIVPRRWRSSMDIELYRVNPTMGAVEHGLDGEIDRPSDAENYPSFAVLEDMGFMTSISAPPNAETRASIATGSSLLAVEDRRVRP